MSIPTAIPPLTVRLFGPLQIQIQGQPLPQMHSRKGQWLLALLLLHPDHPLERTELSGLLWPDSDQSQALANLRLNLADLRRALGSEAFRLQAPTPRTLRFDTTGADIDLHIFRAVLARGDAQALQTAVTLYRGPLLAGCKEEWVTLERLAHEQACIEALETLSAQALSRQAPEAAIPYLRRAIALNPLQESAHRALMQALAEAGEMTEALQVFRQFRDYLYNALHSEPAPQTTALYRRLREQARPSVGIPAVPSSAVPSSVESTKGGIASRPLSQPLTSLIGREQQIKAIAGCLTASRLVTLTGAGGVGKTRLAIAVAHARAQEFVDGVWFVDLAALSDPALVALTVALALHVDEVADRTITQRLQEYLQEKQLLLVIDNCEHLLEACVRLIANLLLHCPSLRVLATSRQALGMLGEQRWRVPSLETPQPEALVSEKEGETAWMEYPAVRLFVERAQAVDVGFVPKCGDAEWIAEICRRLDGIPLAIEFAAARISALSLEQIAVRLQACLRLLRSGHREALPRQQTLQATIDWSYGLLSPPEQALLRRLCVFAGGWTLEAAEAVCSADVGKERDRTRSDASPPPCTLHPDEVLDLLISLVEKSLVVGEQHGSQTRYRLLETVRQYAQERLTEAGDEVPVRARHRNYFLELAEQAETHLHGPEQLAWLERLEREYDNLRVALERSLTGEADTEIALRLAGALWPFWEIHGHLTEGRKQLACVLASVSEAPVGSCWLNVRNGAGVLAWNQGDVETASALMEANLAMARRQNDWRNTALSLLYLSRLKAGDTQNRSDNKQQIEVARSLGEESLALWRDLGDLHGLCSCLAALSHYAYRQGEMEKARSPLRECLALARQSGDLQNVAGALNMFGNLAWAERNLAEARRFYTECLSLQRQCGNRRGIAVTLRNMGLVIASQGDPGAAYTCLQEGLAIYRALGSAIDSAVMLYDLGETARYAGDYAAASAYATQALQIVRMHNDDERVELILCGLCWTAWLQQDETALYDYHQQFLALREGQSEHPWNASLYRYKGRLACERGDYARARAMFAEAQRYVVPMDCHLLHSFGFLALEEGDYDGAFAHFVQSVTSPNARCSPSFTTEVLGYMAILASEQGQYVRAVRLLGAAQTLCDIGGFAVSFHNRSLIEPVLQRTHDVLDASTFALAWKEGGVMSHEQSSAYAAGLDSAL